MNLFESLQNIKESELEPEVTLTEAPGINYRKYGFERKPERDFSDDGSRFRAYSYTTDKGSINATVTTYQGDVYFSLRPDDDEDLDYDEYSKLPSYKDCDKFNGVPMANFDGEEAARIAAKMIDEMSELKASITDVDDNAWNEYSTKTDTLNKDVYKKAQDMLNKVGPEFILGLNEYKIKRIAGFIKDLKNAATDEPFNKDMNQKYKRTQLSKEPKAKRGWTLKYIAQELGLSTDDLEENIKLESKIDDLKYIFDFAGFDDSEISVTEELEKTIESIKSKYGNITEDLIEDLVLTNELNSIDGYNIFEYYKLIEAENPENVEVNTLIKSIVNGDSKAYAKLRKMGYEVEYDDSARKQFGRDSFGDKITVKNTDTGKIIYSNVGQRWTTDTLIAKTDKDLSVSNPERHNKTWHTLKGGKYSSGKETGDPDKFDYKNFLDKPQADLKGDQLGNTVQQFKKDKSFLKDKEYDAQRIDSARSRISDIRKRMGKE